MQPLPDTPVQLHLQVEVDEGAPLEAVSACAVFGAGRRTMIGLGFAGLMLLAVAAKTALSSHTSLSGSATPSAHNAALAFSPSMRLDPPSRFRGVDKFLGSPSSLRAPSSLRTAPRQGATRLPMVAETSSSERRFWPDGQRSYLFVDRRGEEVNANFKPPSWFSGSRSEGKYKNSHRVTFTMPEDEGKDLRMTTVELLKSNLKDNPTFGAVAVKLPLSIEPRSADRSGKMFSAQNRVVVGVVKEGGHGKMANLRPGDIIRGVSMPDEAGMGPQKANAWWDVLGVASAKVENGMAMFDNEGVAAYDGALKANERVHGNNAEVILLIERQVVVERGGGDDDDWFTPGGPGIMQRISDGLPGQPQMTPSGAGAGAGPGVMGNPV